MTTRITITCHGPKDIKVVGGTNLPPGGDRVVAGTSKDVYVSEGYGLSVMEAEPVVGHTPSYDQVVIAETQRLLDAAKPAFPGTTDTRTVTDVDEYIKAENAKVAGFGGIGSGGGGDFAGAGASGTWEAAPAPSPAPADAPVEAPAPAPTPSWE